MLEWKFKRTEAISSVKIPFGVTQYSIGTDLWRCSLLFHDAGGTGGTANREVGTCNKEARNIQ